MEEALRLRELVVRAVCEKDYEHLPRLLRLLAKLRPTEEVLRGSGIGHLVGDRHLWGLAGFTVQQRAACTLAFSSQAVPGRYMAIREGAA